MTEQPISAEAAQAIDDTLTGMMMVLLAGPQAWQYIEVPKLTKEHARLLLAMSKMDDDVRKITFDMSWIEGQRDALQRLIARRFQAMELWAVESGRTDLLCRNRELLDRALDE